MVKYQQDPPKCTSLHGNSCFRILDAAVWRAERPERVEKKVAKKKSLVVCISPYRPDEPRGVANLKLCPLGKTTELINPTKFQLDPPLVLTPRGGGRSWRSPIDYPNDSYN